MLHYVPGEVPSPRNIHPDLLRQKQRWPLVAKFGPESSVQPFIGHP